LSVPVSLPREHLVEKYVKNSLWRHQAREGREEYDSDNLGWPYRIFKGGSSSIESKYFLR
jgi:hypothetical protein